MSIEQLDANNREQEKKRKRDIEASETFFLEKKILLQSTNLRKKLAEEISKEFGLNIVEAQNLIESSTSGNLDSLKDQVSSDMSVQKIEALSHAILRAKSQIEDLSKSHREELKNFLEKNEYTPEKHEYITSKKFIPEHIITRAENPKKTTDHMLGIVIGLIDSGEAVVVFSYKLGKGIIFTPYHLFLLLTGRGKYEGFQDI